MYSPSWTMLLLFTHMLTNNISTEITTIKRDKFDKLITSFRTAVDNGGVLDKESTLYNDIFDSFRLALKFYRFKERYVIAPYTVKHCGYFYADTGFFSLLNLLSFEKSQI